MGKNKVVTGIVAGLIIPIAIGIGVKQLVTAPSTKLAVAKAKKVAHKKAKEVYKKAGTAFGLR